MYHQKVSKGKDNKEVVHFSDNQTFYYQGLLFKIFKTGSKHPKAPELALLKVDTQERVSGLFKIDTNHFQGDTKSTEKKQYFRLKFLDKNTIELTNFNTSLIVGGYITPETETEDFTGHYSTLQSTTMGVDDSTEVKLGIQTITGQLNMTGEPI